MPPTLPPGFELMAPQGDAWAAAVKAARASAEPGSVFWDGKSGHCRAAVVLAPDRPVAEQALLDIALLSLFDAMAVLAPPQVPIAMLPDGIAIDGAQAALIQVWVAADHVSWAVLGFDVAVAARTGDPGDKPGETCLTEEGFGPVTQADILAETCRYLLRWVDVWHEGGAAALAAARADAVAVPA